MLNQFMKECSNFNVTFVTQNIPQNMGCFITQQEFMIKLIKKIQYNIFNNTFTSQIGLQYHLKSVHEGEKHFSCETCPKSFTSKQGLNYHYEKCTSSYESKQDLKVHTEAV